MNIKTWLFITLCSVWLFSSPVKADLIAQDWQVPGDSKLTLDPSTGLMWLSFSETFGWSFNAVQRELLQGDRFQGFRLPTEREVRQIMSTALIGDESGPVLQYFNKDLYFDQFVSRFSSTLSGGMTQSYAMHQIDDGRVVLSGLRDSAVNGQPSSDYLYHYHYAAAHITADFASIHAGVWLVKASLAFNPSSFRDVSTPSFSGLLFVFLLGLFLSLLARFSVKKPAFWVKRKTNALQLDHNENR